VWHKSDCKCHQLWWCWKKGKIDTSHEAKQGFAMSNKETGKIIFFWQRWEWIACCTFTLSDVSNGACLPSTWELKKTKKYAAKDKLLEQRKLEICTRQLLIHPSETTNMPFSQIRLKICQVTPEGDSWRHQDFFEIKWRQCACSKRKEHKEKSQGRLQMTALKLQRNSWRHTRVSFYLLTSCVLMGSLFSWLYLKTGGQLPFGTSKTEKKQVCWWCLEAVDDAFANCNKAGFETKEFHADDEFWCFSWKTIQRQSMLSLMFVQHRSMNPKLKDWLEWPRKDMLPPTTALSRIWPWSATFLVVVATVFRRFRWSRSIVTICVTKSR